MYDMYIAQREGPNVDMYTAKGEIHDAQYVQCPRGGVPMYDMYSAQGGGSQCIMCKFSKGGGPNVQYVQCPKGGGPNVPYVQCPMGGSQCTICTVPKGRVGM